MKGELPGKQRTDWVDIARFLAIVPIILVHCPISGELRAALDVVFQMSWVWLFFFLSGYFSGKKAPDFRKDGRRGLSLLIPYLIWNTLYLLINCVPVMVEAWDRGGAQGLVSYVVREGYGIGGVPVFVPLWFLRDLVIFSLLRSCFQMIPHWLKWAVVALLVCIPEEFVIREGWQHVLPSFVGLRYFLLGILLSNISLEKIRGVLFARPWAFVAASLVLSCIKYSYFSYYGEVSTWLGILGLMAAGVWISEGVPRIGRFMASWSPLIFLIYVSHVLVLTLVFKLLYLFGVGHVDDWFYPVCFLPFTFFFAWGFHWLVRRYAPPLLPHLTMCSK